MPVKKNLINLLFAIFFSPPIYAGWLTDAQPTNRVGQYDFGYQISGVRDSLLHVFDNGTTTYFQFRTGANPPVLFSLDTGAPVLLQVKQEGAYFTVHGVFKSFQMQSNGQQMVVITYQGSRPFTPPSPASVVPSSVQNIVEPKSSVAIPVAGDAINETVYRVTLPFVIGKTTLGPKGETELAQIVRLGKSSGVSSIRIFAPIDPGGTSSFALMRAAEIQRRMSKAGFSNIKFHLDTITPEPLEDTVVANIDMVFDKPIEQTASKPAPKAQTASTVPVAPLQAEPSALKGSFRIEKNGVGNSNALSFDMSSIGKRMTPSQIARVSNFYGDSLAGARFVVKTDSTSVGATKGREVKFQLDRLGAADVTVITELGRQMIEISKEAQ